MQHRYQKRLLVLETPGRPFQKGILQVSKGVKALVIRCWDPIPRASIRYSLYIYIDVYTHHLLYTFLSVPIYIYT